MRRLLYLLLLSSILLIPLTGHASTKKINMGQFKLTAYCPCYECSEGYGRRTATCCYARSGHTIAIDPSVIGYGTKVLINGEVYTAEDCGGGVCGDHIDIFFDTHEEVEEFGVKYENIWILKKAKG